MFLHSGASLHGHEYSKKQLSPIAGETAAHRRDSLFRTSFAAPITRPSTYTDSRATPPSPISRSNSYPSKAVRRPRPGDRTVTSDSVARSRGPAHGPGVHQLEALSEDEHSDDVSDSDSSCATSSVKHRPRRTPRQGTAYLLAQRAPTYSTKQKLIHIHPKLLLQLQEVSSGTRARPTIDVYPAFGMANTIIAAHLCKRFPRLSRVKREESIQDVYLVKSEDYEPTTSDSDSGGEEEGIKDRDLVAILSPLTGQDKAEIVLPDGTIWTAAPRKVQGRCFSYEFTTVDEDGKMKTARWVRRRDDQPGNTAKPSSMPPTPMSEAPSCPFSLSSPSPPAPPSADKFTFSMIDPSCRRHPILAVLKPTSLDIHDTYITVPETSGQCHPPSATSRTDVGSDFEEKSAPRGTRNVEEWQKAFIQVSALWVALRHGWVPHFRTDFIPQHASSTSSTEKSLSHRRSFSTGTDTAKTVTALARNLTGRRSQQPLATCEEDPTDPRKLPKRATSTGAVRIQRLRARESLDDGDNGGMTLNGRRTLSSDWNGVLAHRMEENSLGSVLEPMDSEYGQEGEAHNSVAPSSSTASSISDRRAAWRYLDSSQPQTPAPGSDTTFNYSNGSSPDPMKEYISGGDWGEPHRRRLHRWGSVANWLNKFRAH